MDHIKRGPFHLKSSGVTKQFHQQVSIEEDILCDMLAHVVILQYFSISLLGIRIMTNKPFTRSSSSPGISNVSGSPAFERVSNSARRGSDGSHRQRHMPSSQTVMSAPLPYWVAEGAPLVVPSGEVQMLPVQAPGMQGMQGMPVPVMTGPAPTSQQSGKVVCCVL